MTCHKRGEKVIWVSPVSGKQSYAIFVRHDLDGFPKRDVFLAIKLHKMTHIFRWPLRYVKGVKKSARSS